ncbi:MAG: Uma2 family endonuclease [Planctomycetota bacterium]
MATVPTTEPAETRTRIENVSWETFERLAEERRGSVPRMTYDEGVLELMSPRRQHENIGCLIGRVVETYTEVHDIEIQSVASTTFKRRDLEKAFEADESYYVAHADLIRRKEEVDLLVDPPPDLVIEVEITSSAIAKMSLFARMGVPEVWRHNGSDLTLMRLHGSSYEEIASSVEVRGLSQIMVAEVLQRRFDIGETENIKRFRASLSDSSSS